MIVTNDVVVVVDGAGLPKSMRAGCLHSVAWFARTIAETFHAALTARSGTMAEALGHTIRQVRDSHASTCDLPAGSPSATVAAWRLTEDNVELLVLCDASILLVDNHGHATQVTDRRLETAVVAATRQLLARADTSNAPVPPRKAARIAVESQRNHEGGWWCINSDPAAADHALTGTRRILELAGVIACSDGATRAFDLLATHTVDDFAARCLAGSIEPVSTSIREAETSTAHLLQTKGMKPHDDLTIVATSWNVQAC